MGFIHKKTVPVALFFILLISIVSAETSYNDLGGTGQDYNSDLSQFDTDVNAFPSPRPLSRPRQMPLVADMDNDSVNEIIVLDGFTFKAYSGVTLNPELSYAPLSSNLTQTNFILYNIDNDDYIELITTDWIGNRILISEYNGTHWYTEYNHSVAFPMDEGVISCTDTEKCLLIYADNTNKAVRGSAFNSTQIRNNFIYISGTTENFCFPQIRDAQVINYDNIGETEVIIPVFDILNDDITIIYGYVNESLHAQERDKISFSSGVNTGECGEARTLFSSVLVQDTSVLNPGKETTLLYQSGADQFQIISYDSGGNKLYEEPGGIYYVSGETPGGVMLSSAFEDTGEVDVCGFIVSKQFNNIKLICYSSDTNNDHQTRLYTFDINNGSLNISVPSPLYSGAVHSFDVEGLENTINEVVTPYGVFKLLPETCEYDIFNGMDICEMDILYYNHLQVENAVIPVDANKTGYEDLVFITDQNIYYVNDQFVNTQANFTGTTTIDPCMLSQQAKINTTIQIVTTISDIDGDNVNLTAILYYNEDLESPVIQKVNNTPSSFFVEIGTYSGGNMVSLAENDLDYFTFYETLVSPRRKNITFNFTNLKCLDGDATLFVNYTSPEIPATDQIVFMIKNQSSGLWVDNILRLNMTDYNRYTQNSTVFTKNILNSGYIQGGLLELKFHDNLTQTDNSNDVSRFNKLVIQCNQLITGASSAEQRVSLTGKSGTPFNVIFVANKTTSGSILRLEARDDRPSSQDNPNIIERTFRVGNTGVEFGGLCKDVITHVPNNQTPIVDGEPTTQDKRDVVEAVMPSGIIPKQFRLLFLLLIMVIFSGASIFYMVQHGITSPTLLLYVPMGIAGLIWIFGAVFDIVPGWTIIVGILIASAIVGFKFYERNTSISG